MASGSPGRSARCTARSARWWPLPKKAAGSTATSAGSCSTGCPAAAPRSTTQLAVALGSRARPGTLANPLLPAAVAAALALQFAGLYLLFLQELLHTEPLTGIDLLVVFLLSTLGYAAVRLDRVLFRRRRPADPPGTASGARP